MLGIPKSNLPYAVGNSGIRQFHQISVCDGVKTPKFSAPPTIPISYNNQFVLPFPVVPT